MYMTTNLSTTQVGQSTATVLARTWNPKTKQEIITWELMYPRYIHSELMTHRCLVGSTVLTFDLPAGAGESEHRPYTMTMFDFWDKWENGSAPHTTRWGGVRRYDMKGRLNKMRLRSVDESTMEVAHTTITDCWKVGVKPVFKLTAGTYSVTATADHLILTDKGWKELQDIAIGEDKVYCNTRKKFTQPPYDPYKKIDGRWVSRWTKEVLPEVLERQGGVCADCGCRKGPFEVHHVVPKHEAPERAFDLDNVVALCERCHKTRHSKQGWQGTSQCNVLAIEVDSIEPAGEEEVFDISVSSEYHNFLANGVLVHNCFSRNAASSRATPTRVLVEEVRKRPVFFDEVRLNQKGMTGGELVGGEVLKEFKRQWEDAANTAADYAENWLKMGIAKQTVNRILEPFLPIRTIVTATDIDNFFKLRLAPDAQPEIQSLAKAMRDSREKAGVSVEEVHIPYAEYFTDKAEHLVARAIAACARVSVARNDGKKTTYEEDLAFTKRLLSAGHMTPFEHVAYATSHKGRYANLSDWMSVRWIAEHQPEAKDVP